ncbi:MAG: heme ABC transporter ATP-binding protein [Pseudomonadales bacterium]|nr:heme ABC transporter ATP-binding protein [Pseudomonadales bacterium]MCP5303544.1 heme ABC transporter ATP-binding protein [Pseudomonadales bacterium]
MLSASHISLQLGGASLLEDVSLRCEVGTVTSLMGPNGAGKTSLLRVLASEYRDYQGHVELNGRPLNAWQRLDRARTMAVLPQHSTLDFPFQVDEVVMLGRIPHDTGVVRDRQIVRAALEKVDAQYLSGRAYPQLSGGEKQRVQLARVLAQIWEPPQIDGKTGGRVLLLDEPSASFDLAHQQLLREIVRGMACEGVTVVMVVHDFNLAASVSDQLMVLCCGRTAATGEPQQVLHSALIEQVFGVPVEVLPHPVTGKPLIFS